MVVIIQSSAECDGDLSLNKALHLPTRNPMSDDQGIDEMPPQGLQRKGGAQSRVDPHDKSKPHYIGNLEWLNAHHPLVMNPKRAKTDKSKHGEPRSIADHVGPPMDRILQIAMAPNKRVEKVASRETIKNRSERGKSRISSAGHSQVTLLNGDPQRGPTRPIGKEKTSMRTSGPQINIPSDAETDTLSGNPDNKRKDGGKALFLSNNLEPNPFQTTDQTSSTKATTPVRLVDGKGQVRHPGTPTLEVALALAAEAGGACDRAACVSLLGRSGAPGSLSPIALTSERWAHLDSKAVDSQLENLGALNAEASTATEASAETRKRTPHGTETSRTPSPPGVLDDSEIGTFRCLRTAKMDTTYRRTSSILEKS